MKKIAFLLTTILTLTLLSGEKAPKQNKTQKKSVQKALELLYGKKEVEKMQKKDTKTEKQPQKEKKTKTKKQPPKKIKKEKKQEKKVIKNRKKVQKEEKKQTKTKIKVKKTQKKRKKRKKRRRPTKKIIIKIKKWLQPLTCNPAIKKTAIKVIPITDVDYKFNAKRGIWIPVGKKDGLKKGMSLIVCRNIGKQHLMPISDITLKEVWENNSTAVPISKFDPDTNQNTGIREGDLILFRMRVSKKRIVINLRKGKKKEKKKKTNDICPLKCLENPKNLYDKDSFPQFTEDMLKYNPNSKLRKELKKEKEKFNKKTKTQKKQKK